MRLEVRDLESSTVYDVPSGGAVIGRERAKTDIALRDESISKRHARIFLENGAWFLEDLNSSNGTFIDEVRISAPVQLNKGAMFSLAQRKFEVIFIEGANGVASNSNNGRSNALENRDSGFPSDGGDEVGVGSGSDGDEDNVESKGVAYFFVAVPKAIGFYLLNVPLMALNPIGTIRKGVEEQPHAAMGRMELAAYFIPAAAFTSLLGAIAAVIATLIAGGGFAFAVLITALPIAAIGAVISGVVGFFFHPILKWIVNFLKGESSARSRTNYALMMQTFTVLSAVPNALAMILASLPIPFIGLLGPLLSLVVSGIGLFLAYNWVKAFRLVKWMEYVVLVLGVLAVLGTAVGFITGLIAQITGGGTPGIATTSGAGDVEIPEIPELTDAEKDALKAAGQDPDVIMQQRRDAAKMAAEAMKAAQAATAEATGTAPDEAMEAAKKAIETAKAKEAEAAAKAGTEAAAEGATEKAAPGTEKAAEKAAEKVAEKAPPPPPPPEKAAEKVAEKAPPPPPPPPVRSPPPESGRTAQPLGMATTARRPASADLESNPLPTDDHPLGITPFVEYLAKRDAVEKAIADKPELIKNKKILDDYRSLWKDTYEVREKYKKKKGERYELEKIVVRQKDQEVYEKTKAVVDRLYAQVFP